MGVKWFSIGPKAIPVRKVFDWAAWHEGVEDDMQEATKPNPSSLARRKTLTMSRLSAKTPITLKINLEMWGLIDWESYLT